MTPAEIRDRAKAIRMPAKLLGEGCGIAENTAWRVLSGDVDPRTSTLNGMRQALKDEEVRQLLRLAALYPDLVTINTKQSEAAE